MSRFATPLNAPCNTLQRPSRTNNVSLAFCKCLLLELTSKRIMRIIFFFPILALISFGQVFLAADALYLQPWASLFEAFAIGSFFMLVSAFLSRFRSTSRYEEEAFRLKDGSSISHNVLSVSSYSTRRRCLNDSIAQRKRIAVFQYALVAVVLGAVTDITLKANVYCETTNNAHFSKIWVSYARCLREKWLTKAVNCLQNPLRGRRSRFSRHLHVEGESNIETAPGLQKAPSIEVDHHHGDYPECMAACPTRYP